MADQSRLFENAVLPHLDAAHNLARWILGDEEEARDVVQEASMRALKYFNTLRGEDALPWLLQIVRNTAFTWLQRRQRHDAVEPLTDDAMIPDPSTPDPASIISDQLDAESLTRAVESLPAEFREVIILRELEGMSYKQIAHVTGASIGTVMSRISRARRRAWKLLLFNRPIRSSIVECKRAQNLIDAFFDEELDPLHALEVEDHVQECSRCAAALQRRKALRQALRSKLPYHPAPATLRRNVTGGTPRWWRPAMALAACLLLAIGGLSFALLLRPPGRGADISLQLADAIESDHVRSLLNPDHLTDVLSTDKHTVKPWFAGKLPFAPPVPDLAADGFPLLGGRLDDIQHRTVVALIYKKDKHIINLFIWPSDAPAASSATSTTARGYHLNHWIANSMEFWAVSDVESKELDRFADLQRAASTTNH